MVVNGHGGNYVLGNVVQESSARGERMALFPAAEDWEAARERAGVVTSLLTDMHAGEIETSILLHAHPEMLRPGYETSDFVADDRRHLLTLGMSGYTDSGVIGRPSLGSAEKGKELLASLADSFGAYFSLLTSDARCLADTGDEMAAGAGSAGARPGSARRPVYQRATRTTAPGRRGHEAEHAVHDGDGQSACRRPVPAAPNAQAVTPSRGPKPPTFSGSPMASRARTASGSRTATEAAAPATGRRARTCAR